MNAKKCDRCGILYEADNKKQSCKLAFVTSTASGYLKSMDLCNKCQNDLINWFEKPLFEGGCYESKTL